ncbi:hypothetical protein ACEWY4_001650 [Coilia grayii]|uniref:Uncharacterized protein n=1 Tax=Coilia grayii TaxID=363190 RepID=A0ABD1KTL4_9TELE
MEREINEISHHVDASHEQACIDLEKASQFITEAVQNEVQRNMALRMLIHRLEERASENGRSLSEQAESNRQLKLQIDELQKHLEHKDNSLTQANQTIAILKNELRDVQQQLQSHQSNHRMIQEMTEWLQDRESQPNVVKEEDSLLQNVVMGIKEEDDAADEDDDGYQCSRSDEADTPTEQTTFSSADIKAELVQEQDEESDMAPVLSSEINQSPPDAVPLVKFLGLSVQVVDCCATQDQEGTDSKNNKDGEKHETGRGSRLSLSAVPKFTAIPEAMMPNGTTEEMPARRQEIRQTRRTRVLIIGSSYIRGAKERGMQTLGLNLCMQAQIEWLGVGGMRWYSVLPGILNWIFSKRFPPDVVLIYCGGNDLGKRKSVELVTAMKDDMTYLHWRFPKLRIVYSAITQRRRWGTRQRAFPPKGIDRARKWVNNAHVKWLTLCQR